MARQRSVVLALALCVLFPAFAPRGTTQVPVDILPPYSLQTGEDFGSFRESLRVITESPGMGFPLIDVRFRKLWATGPSDLYVGSYTTPCGAPSFSTSSAVLAFPLTLDSFQFVYVHQSGGPCAVPPDSLYNALAARPTRKLKSSNTIGNQIQLNFLLYLLEIVEQSDPANVLPQLLNQLASPNQALFDISLSNDGSLVLCELVIGDTTDPTGPTSSLLVEANYNGASFDSVGVR